MDPEKVNENPEQNQDNLMQEILDVYSGVTPLEGIDDDEPEKEEKTEEPKEEQDEEEEEEQEEEQEEEEEEPEYYTPEELRELSKSGEPIDMNRIPPELQGLAKQLQADYTRKTQKLAEERKRIMQQQQQMAMLQQFATPQTSNLPADQLVRVNPELALQKLQAEYEQVVNDWAKALEEDDIFKASKLQFKEAQLKAAMDRLKEEVGKQREIANRFFEKASDFIDKRDEITDWVTSVIEDDPITPEELALLTSPAVLGPAAFKAARLFYELYKQREAAKVNVPTKEKKPKPPRVSKSKPREDTNAKLDKAKQLQAAKKRALATGSEDDWAKYLDVLTGGEE